MINSRFLFRVVHFRYVCLTVFVCKWLLYASALIYKCTVFDSAFYTNLKNQVYHISSIYIYYWVEKTTLRIIGILIKTNIWYLWRTKYWPNKIHLWQIFLKLKRATILRWIGTETWNLQLRFYFKATIRCWYP